jgi:hypothetical protein
MNTTTTVAARPVTTDVFDEITGEHIVSVERELHYGDMAGGGVVVHVSCRTPSRWTATVRRI